MVVCEVACRVILALLLHQLLSGRQIGVLGEFVRLSGIDHLDLIGGRRGSHRFRPADAHPPRGASGRHDRLRHLFDLLLIRLLLGPGHFVAGVLRYDVLIIVYRFLRSLLLVRKGVCRLAFLGEGGVALHERAKGDHQQQDQEEAHQEERPHHTYVHRQESRRLAPEYSSGEEKPPVGPLGRHQSQGDRCPERRTDAEADLTEP